jgi:hypothetical protein
MGRLSMGSYAHRIAYMGRGTYQMVWTVDRKVMGSRVRFPNVHRRDTDRAGAERFAKKWGVAMPEEAPPC